MDGYHFYDNLNDDNKNFLMADAGMFLTIKHVRFTLNFNNILNKTTYSYSRITDLSTYRYTSNIRPGVSCLKSGLKYYSEYLQNRNPSLCKKKITPWGKC